MWIQLLHPRNVSKSVFYLSNAIIGRRKQGMHPPPLYQTTQQSWDFLATCSPDWVIHVVLQMWMDPDMDGLLIRRQLCRWTTCPQDKQTTAIVLPPMIILFSCFHCQIILNLFKKHSTNFWYHISHQWSYYLRCCIEWIWPNILIGQQALLAHA
jgi:hypothetical protein